MKKALLLTVIALCAVSVSAVTYSWTNRADTNRGWPSATDHPLTSNNANTPLFTLTASTDTSFFMNTAGLGVQQSYSGTTTLGAVASPNLTIASIVIGGGGDNDWKKTPTTWRILLVNGDKKYLSEANVRTEGKITGTNWGACTDLTSTGANAEVSSAWANTFTFTDEIKLSAGETYEVYLVTGDDINNPEYATKNPANAGPEYRTYNGVISYDVQILPEPTALALLALGVAGLALKRKVK